jgi:DNA-3-methyladenine glycosylase I
VWLELPVHDDRILFELLILEGAQAGLAWQTVLNKRENYREAFSGFEPGKIARYGSKTCGDYSVTPGSFGIG